MKPESYSFKIFKIVLSLLIFFFLIVVIFQFDNFEKRTIDLSKSLNYLKEQQTELKNRLNSIQNKLDSGEYAYSGSGNNTNKINKRWLHPEVESIVEDAPYFEVDPGANYESTISIRAISTEKGYNPILENAANVTMFYTYTNAPIAKRYWNNPNRYMGYAAKRVENVNHGKTFIVYLRKGIKWHRPMVDFSNKRYKWLDKDHYLTAHDFKFYYDTIMNPQVEAGAHRNYYKDVESFKIIDDYTFQIDWKEKLYHAKPFTLEMEPLPCFLFQYDEDGNKFPKEVFGLKFNNHWYNNRIMGCGAYYLESIKEGIELVFRRNPEFNIPVKHAPKRIIYKIIKDNNLTLLKLKGNELDIYTRITESVYRDEILTKKPDSPFITGDLGYKIYTRPVYYYIGWNSSRELFKSKYVRRALTYAFDREGVLKRVLGGLGQVITGGIHPLYDDYDKTINPFEFNLEKAAKLLAQEGWKDRDKNGILEKIINGEKKEFKFSLLVIPIPIYKSMYSMYKENLNKIGIKMDIRFLDWALYLKKIDARDFDAFHGVWVLSSYTDPYQIWHSSQADVPRGSNRVNFKNSEADKIIMEARRTFGHKKRVKLFHRFHQILHEEQPYTFLFARKGFLGHNKKVKGIKIRFFKPLVLADTMHKE